MASNFWNRNTSDSSSDILEQMLDSLPQRRDGQRLITNRIFKKLNDKLDDFSQDCLVVPAGVGTGKTFGYLIPLMAHISCFDKSLTSDEKFLIVTPTIGLQEQVLNSITNVNKILESIGRNPINSSVVKGMNHYACKRAIINYYEKLKNEIKDPNNEMGMIYSKIIDEYSNMDYIDLSKIKNPELRIALLENGSIDLSRCSKCCYYKSCYPSHLKKLQDPRIIVINYGILYQWLKEKNPNLSAAKTLILDETHQLFPQGLSSYSEIYNNLYVNNPTFLNSLNISDANFASISRKSKQFNDLQTSINRFYKRLLSHAMSCGNIDSYNDLKNYASLPVILPNDSSSSKTAKELKISISDLIPKICSVSNILNDKISHYIDSGYIKRGGRFDSFEIGKKKRIPSSDLEVIRVLEGIRDLYSVCVDLSNGYDSASYDYFVNPYLKKDKSKTYYCKLQRYPRNISNVMNELLKDKFSVLLSGTTENLEYDLASFDGFNNTRLPNIKSSFDSDNSLIYIDPDMPKPMKDNYKNYEDYTKLMAKKIVESMKLTDGKALVLFTDKKFMNDVYNVVSELLDASSELLKLEYSSDEMTLNKFRENINSTMFSTSSWEGLDVAGESLSNVIITALPFPTPGEPGLFERISNEKNISFNEDDNAITKNVISRITREKLTQGIGRLIRTSEDSGIVTILDGRMRPDYVRASGDSGWYECLKESFGDRNFTTNINDVRKHLEKCNISSKHSR